MPPELTMSVSVPTVIDTILQTTWCSKMARVEEIKKEKE